MITHIVNLFTTQHSLAAWDHTLLSQLLSSLHHSLEHLEDLEQSEGENRDCSNLGILVRKYFQRIHNYLREKKYSACAWEVVRVEITLRVGIMALPRKKVIGELLAQGCSPDAQLSQASSTLLCPWPSCSRYSRPWCCSALAPVQLWAVTLPEDHVLLSRENLVLLSQMSTISPLFCLKDRKHFRFPRATVDGSQVQKAQALSVLHEMLQQIFRPLASENSSVTWNMTLVDQLRTGLHRQLEDLDTCWAQGDGRGGICPGHAGPYPGLEEGDNPQMQKTQRTCFQHPMITHIVNLFTTQRSLAAWDHTLLSQLLSSLHHSLEHLEDLEQREGENRDCSNLGILVRKYFQRIHNYLREKKYSACAWEVVRVEITLRVGIMALPRKKVIGELLAQGCSPDAQLSQASSTLLCPWPSCSRYSQPWCCSALAPGELWAVTRLGPRPAQQGELSASEPNEHHLPSLLSEGQKALQIPRATVDGSQVQKAQDLSVLHEMLQQIFDLLSTENSSVTWNTTLVDQLRTGLHRQLEDLDTCWAWEMGEEGSALATQGPTLALKRYFQGLRLYLKEKKYSDCAWEVVRVEIMRSFSSTSALQERLRNKDGDVGSP
ncbi:hypothetical protein QTO34_005577 [Cnephaeus nilssonii]|uniref:Uncharacterized protein n=1 Tax=Cnephaeus nilssonii TaxID=3371016 RepID=A0AA40HNL5_CNENI|nr:hypothetical protein QTO34_005577 [Eptesicus nilssonii]